MPPMAVSSPWMTSRKYSSHGTLSLLDATPGSCQFHMNETPLLSAPPPPKLPKSFRINWPFQSTLLTPALWIPQKAGKAIGDLVVKS